MFESLELTFLANCRLDPKQTILAAVSGGPDSLCLLHLFWGFGYTIVVAHLDHGLRPESTTEARQVQRITESLGFRYVGARRDVAGFASHNGLSLEEAAREVRYRFLFEQAENLKTQSVATGHTADDQVETVLMHLLRGAGLAGLRGMSFYSLPNAWSRTIPLVRPLLGTWREEIMAYLDRVGLKPSLDSSNLERRYYRNRLRHELIPQLEILNPGARTRIWRMASLLRDENEVIEQVVEAAWSQSSLVIGEKTVALNTSALRRQSKGVQRRLVRRAIAHLQPGLRDIDYEAVERVLDFMAMPSQSRRLDLVAGLRLEIEGERLWIAAWKADLPDENLPQLNPGEILELAVPGETRLPGRWVIRAEILPADENILAQAQANHDLYQAWMDLERLRQPLLVRGRLTGERFRPLGMGGHSIKLSDFMVNVHLPRQRRDNWPLLVSGEEVDWVPGYRIAERVAVCQSTRSILRLILKTGFNQLS